MLFAKCRPFCTGLNVLCAVVKLNVSADDSVCEIVRWGGRDPETMTETNTSSQWFLGIVDRLSLLSGVVASATGWSTASFIALLSVSKIFVNV